MRTLTVDIGGTGIKTLLLDVAGQPIGERVRERTPKPSTPANVLALIERMMVASQPFDRVSVGFPGVVVRGVVRTANNLGTKQWCGFDLQNAIGALTGKPTRVINDADLLGYGVIEGKGIELVLTFGTGFGTALYVDGHLVPNLELAHHPLLKGKTYEELTSDKQLKRIGKRAWRKRVARIFEVLEPVFNYDLLHVGGGNSESLKPPLPDRVRIFSAVAGMTGGMRLWADTGN
jgi:polyphosphate glucokinase